MKVHRTVLCIMSSILMASLLVGCAQSAVKSGVKAPAFKLPSIDGKTMSLADIRKNPNKKDQTRAVIVDFWATWCPPCREETKLLQKLHKKYGKKVAIVGIALDNSPSEVKKFAKDHKLDYIILLDPNNKVAKQYGVRPIPTTFILDKKGIIKESHIGYSPKISKAIERQIKSLL